MNIGGKALAGGRNVTKEQAIENLEVLLEAVQDEENECQEEMEETILMAINALSKDIEVEKRRNRRKGYRNRKAF